MKRTFLPVLAMVILFGSGNHLSGQTKTTLPFMKIAVKDGKVVCAEPLDTTGNNFIILQDGVDQNARFHTSMSEDDKVYPSNLLKAASVEAWEKPEKGSSLPGRIELASEVLDVNNANVQYNSGIDNDSKEDINPDDFNPEAGWEVITYETFEGSFPAVGWDCYPASGFADAYWDDNSYRSNTGSWSMFCAGMGTAAVTPPATYPVDMNTWAIYGPFDLSDATGAELDFMLWLDSESGYDYFKYMVSIDAVNFYGFQISGNTDGWSNQNMDLNNVPTIGDVTGGSSVYVALIFESDYSVNFEGAFVDDLLIQKYVEDSGEPDLAPLSMTLSESQWNIGSTIYSDITEENIGGVNAGAHESMIVMSVDNSVTTSDMQLGPLVSFPVINAGASTMVSTSWQVPDVSQGTYYLGLLVDVNDDVSESDESNNSGVRSGTVEIMGIPEPDINVTPTSLTIIEPLAEQTAQAEQSYLGPIQKVSGSAADGPIIPNQVIVRFKGSEMTTLKGINAKSSDFEYFSSEHKVVVIKEMRKPRSQLESHANSSTVLIQLEHEGTVQDVIRELIEMDIVEHAEPNYLLKHDD
ncbi:MAG: CARDB domain-containing protein, partial [Bacteroidota bacterium]|nr:CARDB domain-containing protein [Bacteroidota bacterium]